MEVRDYKALLALFLAFLFVWVINPAFGEGLLLEEDEVLSLLEGGEVTSSDGEAISSFAEGPLSHFYYMFSNDGSLYEVGSMNQSGSKYWWVNSGAMLVIKNGTGRTNRGELPLGSKWQLLYAIANPDSTDGGIHPQNIFRMVTKSRWQNFTQEVYFRVTKNQLSNSTRRAAHNGLFLMNRYRDGNNLYYTGLRVDGGVVIKKKRAGKYYTLSYKKILPGTYNRLTNPSLIPKNAWIGVRSEVVNNPNGTISINVYTDKNNDGVWEYNLGVIDNSSVISLGGYGGIRTDFMDVEFENYKIRSV